MKGRRKLIRELKIQGMSRQNRWEKNGERAVRPQLKFLRDTEVRSRGGAKGRELE